MYEYSALCLRCIDGDSLHLSIDLGFSTHVHANVRLFGVNCPEKNTDAGKAAATFTADWLAKRLGKVTIKTIKDKGDKYGRMLAHVTDEAGRCLNDELIAAGHAVKYDGGKR